MGTTDANERLVNLLGAISIAVHDEMVGARGLGGFDPPLDHPSVAAAVRTVASQRRAPMPDLAGFLGLSQTATVRVAERMESAGLARRVRPRGARQTVLELTAAGHAAADEIASVRKRAVSALIRSVPRGQRRQLQAALERLAGHLASDDVAALRVCRLCRYSGCGDDDDCPVWRAARKVGRRVR